MFKILYFISVNIPEWQQNPSSIAHTVVDPYYKPDASNTNYVQLTVMN